MFDRLRAFVSRESSSSLSKRLHARLTEGHRRWLRAIIAVIGVAMLTWLFPRESTSEYSGWREGMVAPREVIAPFSFNVRTGDVELEENRARARVSVPPVIRPLLDVEVDQLDRLATFLELVGELSPGASLPDTSLPISREELHETTVAWLVTDGQLGLARRIAPAVLRAIYEQGVLDGDGAGQVRNYFDRREKLLGNELLPELVSYGEGGDADDLLPFSRFPGMGEATDNLGERITRYALSTGRQLSPDALRALHNLILGATVPNRYYDREETIARQTLAAANVALYKRSIFKDERFVESHAVLTSDDIHELRSLAEAVAERQRQAAGWGQWIGVAGRALIVAGILAIVGLCLRQFDGAIWRRPDWLLLSLLLVWLPLTIASYAATNASISVYVIPLPLTGMLAAVLFGPQVAFLLSAATVLIAGVLLGFDFQVVLVNAVASAVAVFSVQNVRNRNRFFRAMLILPAGIVASIAAVDSVQGTSVTAMWNHMWPGAVNGVAVPVLSMGLLVVFEKLFRITTNITLLELSDLNSPLLRQLALRAPGTYTHSLIIANLAESAAEVIGANPLFARVGAYYHDVGKMQRPNHFVENQLYKGNPHDKLSPQMSALVVAAHVKDGIEVAERAGLPKQLVDFIPQHHGTLLITYFYRRAQELYGDENVSEEGFRYPGPKPQTKEAAILMMADAVEAAVRSLRERTASRVQGMVRQLIHDRLDDGQFDECDLTFRELDRIASAFLPVLAGTLHERIEYPEKQVDALAHAGSEGESETAAAENNPPHPPDGEPSDPAV